MEIFLLLLDDLDDLAHALRMMLPRFIGFCFALSVFTLLVMSAMHWPMLVAAVGGGALLIIMSRNLSRTAQFLRLKTDP